MTQTEINDAMKRVFAPLVVIKALCVVVFINRILLPPIVGEVAWVAYLVSAGTLCAVVWTVPLHTSLLRGLLLCAGCGGIGVAVYTWVPFHVVRELGLLIAVETTVWAATVLFGHARGLLRYAPGV